MSRAIIKAGLAVLTLALATAGASSFGFDAAEDRAMESLEPQVVHGTERPEGTLWVYVEDFEEPYGDDYTTSDASGMAPRDNYWHVDTIRPGGGSGISSWWCGTYSTCWVQPRGYGNDWYQLLSRHFTGVTGTGTETVELEFDQRFAMEADYDYGYVDISDNGGGSWVTLATYTNYSGPDGGTPVDWDDPTYGHVVLDISTYSGSDIDIRFRFESDGVFSSADEPMGFSVVDGAWQIDNIEIQVDDVATFYDDCESGDTGWTHDDFPGAGQTGTVWWRGQYGTDFVTGWPGAPGEPPDGSYMFVPTDPLTGKMVDYENTWLLSPPIDIAGEDEVVLEWTGWIDIPYMSNDRFDIWAASSSDQDCVMDYENFIDVTPGSWYGGAFWMTSTTDLSHFTGPDWLSVAFRAWNTEPPPGMIEHATGFFLNRVRIGVPVSTGVVDHGHKHGLSHARPNPFSPATRIAYAVRDAGPVEMRVYNAAGKVVRTLLDAELEAGASGEVVWDGANDIGERCASGVYFYQLVAPGHSDTKKMIMLE